MGTSLSGLTPATTFDGLLKVGDNDPLTATLKPISTGDGTDTILSLSNSTLQVDGVSYLNGLTYINNQDYVFGNSSFSTSNTIKAQGSMIVGDGANPTSTLQVVGSGATSATTSLLVQNSTGSELFKVQDDGRVDFASLFAIGTNIYGTNSSFRINIASSNEYSTFDGHIFKTYDGTAYSEAMRITGNTSQFVGIGETTPTARLHVKGSGTDANTIALRVQNSAGTDTLIIGDDGFFKVRGGAGVSNLIRTNTTNNNVGIGLATPDSASRMHIQGKGATSATTALLVQNSAGTDLMTMRDDGVFMLGAAGNTKFFEGTVVNSKFRVIDNSSLHTVHADGSTNPRVFLRSGPNNSEPNSHYVANYINGTYIGKDVVTPTSTLHVKGSGNTATTTALLVQNSDGNTLLKADDGNNVYAINNKYQLLDSKFVSLGNNNFFGTSVGTAKVQIKGSGATSATTALLVENSAGTQLFKIFDDGNIRIGDSIANKETHFRKFRITDASIFPLSSGNLGENNNTARHYGNIYSLGVTHITDNTTSSTTLDASAKLQVDSTTQGFLPPRMTTLQRDAITTPAAGLMIYNTDTNTAECWNGTAWMPMF